MDELLAEAVRQRAGWACEYCRFSDRVYDAPFEIEHVIAVQHGGGTVLGNLVYACQPCNRHKGPNLSSIDRPTSRTRLVRLFHPRWHRWAYHFAFDGPMIVGRTPIGRVTVALLNINRPSRARFRVELMEEGLWPPPDPPPSAVSDSAGRPR